MKQTKDLAGNEIGPLLPSCYIPAFITVITGALYNIIGRIFIGQRVGMAPFVMQTAMTLTRQVLFLLPMLWIFPQIFGLNGVWISTPVSDGLNGIFVFFLLRKSVRQLDSLIENESAV